MLSAAAFVAVWRYGVGVIPIVVICAVVGVIDTLLT